VTASATGEGVVVGKSESEVKGEVVRVRARARVKRRVATSGGDRARAKGEVSWG
jgi:hypothetical protein